MSVLPGVHGESHPQHVCLTGCAQTYNTIRRGSRGFSKGEFGVIKEDEEAVTKQVDKDNKDPDADLPNTERRRSSFCLAKLAPPPPDPVEGTWKMVQCQKYEKYLEKIGTGPLSLSMVMRARVVVTISQVFTCKMCLSSFDTGLSIGA